MKEQYQRIVTIAKLYYEQGINQQEIAHELNISRALVCKLLARARDLNIVEIQINDPYTSNEKLLNILKEKYNIQSGTIIPSIYDENFYKSTLIEHSILKITDIISKYRNIGFGWGDIIDQVISAFINTSNTTASKCTVCPLIGNLSISNRAFHTNELVRIFAQKIGAETLFLNAPAFPLTQSEQELYMNTENFRQLKDKWMQLDAAIITVASYPTVPDLASAYRLAKKQLPEKIVGEIISYYFGLSGSFIYGEQDYAIRIPVEILKQIKSIVAIIPPNVSIAAIKGAMSSGLISDVIMDEQSATELLFS